jgi:hypothetical protein
MLELMSVWYWQGPMPGSLISGREIYRTMTYDKQVSVVVLGVSVVT